MCVFVIWCDEVQKNTNKMESCCNALIPFLLLTLWYNTYVTERMWGLFFCMHYVLVTVLYISLLSFKVFPVILYLKHT